MKYLQKVREYTVAYKEVVNKPVDHTDEVITEVLIDINLANHKEGFSLNLLTKIIESATTNLSSYRIFHTVDGLTITGKYTL